MDIELTEGAFRRRFCTMHRCRLARGRYGDRTLARQLVLGPAPGRSVGRRQNWFPRQLEPEKPVGCGGESERRRGRKEAGRPAGRLVGSPGPVKAATERNLRRRVMDLTYMTSCSIYSLAIA